MKKALAITLILAMMLGASAFATKTRVMTMGDNNNVLLDEANIWLYPGRLFQYPDMAVAEYNTGPFYVIPFDAEGTDGLAANNSIHEFGVHWKFGDENPFVLGTYLYNADGQTDEIAYLNDGLPLGLNYELYESFGFGFGDFGFVPSNDLVDGPFEFSNRRIGLFYSRQLGGHNFGFYFDKLHNSYRDEDTFDNGDIYTSDDESFSRYTFGLGLTEAQGKWDVSAKLSMITWKDKDFDFSDSTEVDNTKPAGNYSFNVMGRYFYQYNPTITFVPHVGLTMAKFESEDYFYFDGSSTDWHDSPETYKVSGMLIDVGSGMHYTPSAGMLAVLDFGFALAKFDEESSTTNDGGTTFETEETNRTMTTLPYVKIGFEGEVLNWLDIRFGGVTYWRTFTEEDIDTDGVQTDKDVNRYPLNETWLGFSFNWGNLTVDTWTDPELFLRGLNFISGQNTQMNGGITALYNF